MRPRCCALWRTRRPPHVEESLQEALSRIPAGRRLPVFFRADDIVEPEEALKKLMSLFARHRAPLALAVVPAKLPMPYWRALEAMAAGAPALWCWHQHGWRHVNHERRGKKQEFGPARSQTELVTDLDWGREWLQAVMGLAFTPIFTPPWNRCSARTLELLKSRAYLAVSRSAGSQPPPPQGLPDIDVNIDLHTRREKDPRQGWQNLLQEMTAAAEQGLWGVMIHHRRMNTAAFEFLDSLLAALAADPRVDLVGMPELVKSVVGGP